MRVALVVATLALATPAAAQPAPEPAAPTSAVTPPAAPRQGHQGQVQLSLRTAIGMRAIVAYSNQDYCGELDPEASTGNAPVCTSRSPISLDLELGYGVTHKIDAILELRLGLESDFGSTSAMPDGPRMFHLAPGARFFFSDSPRSKLFTTAQLVIDFAGYEDAVGQGRGADFGVRNMNGLWFDLANNYGFYVYVGEVLTFARWMRFELEGGIGISGRYP